MLTKNVDNMADKKKGRKRKEEYPDPNEKPEKPSKEEYEVAKWLRNNVPVKKTKFLYHNVQYFTGSKAVDALLASKWGTPQKEGTEPFFPTREHCIDFLDDMLRHKFFHRAKKVAVNEDMLKGAKKKKGDDKDKKQDKKDKDKKDEKEEKKVDKVKDEEIAESSVAEGRNQETSENEEERKKKKKKKVRLEMHMEQYFADTLDAYVWIYDPIPFHYWLFGTLVVLAGIGMCLFPLWPPQVRLVVYYLSMAVAGFLVFIIALAVIRFIVYCLIWILTLGKHHLWLFPNLTEDVGFFASFWPLYHYEYKGGDSSTKKKKKKKDKLSDNEDEAENVNENSELIKDKEDTTNEKEDVKNDEDDEEGTKGGDEAGSGSESENSSQQSQTGKDFEIVDRAEVEAQ
ncbi:hypothetical protein O3M35_012424 [Rhynocoris fuscipes]|uniref:Translocation protein SEC62 n=1 Tax=Rhynocoris fuscipes TaxID=488301 RepID=A0AAW1CY15_9HEMI